jgi:tRNA threonylcarbamoyladenosine biosynthesis protein TsaE
MEATYTEADTQAIAELVLAELVSFNTGATILALQGDLGAGKTTLTKAIAELLGVTETVVSPTFVIAKYYDIGELQPGETSATGFERLVHIDAYRIEDLNELGPLGWEHLLKNPRTLVIVEWPEKIADALPDNKQHFIITHSGEQRTIKKLYA